mgnify:CR=1 FL=1
MPEHPQHESYVASGNGTISGTVILRAFNANRSSLLIQNLGTASLYVGGSAVSVNDGVQVLTGGEITLDKSNGGAVYVCASGTCNVRFIEEYL